MRISDWSSDVCSSDLLAAVDDEQDQVRLLRTGTRLARGCAGQVAAFQVGVLAGDAAGVDQYERPLLDQPADAVVAVAGDAGLVVHERIAGARQRIEQRRFTDVGTTDKGNEGEHRSEEHTSELQSLM